MKLGTMCKNFCIGVVIGCFGVVASALAYPARIVQVTDGDTLIVEEQNTGSFSRQIIRLYGIDCPEKNQPYGNQATRLTRTFLHRQVEVEPFYADSYGRSVAVLHLEADDTLQAHLLHSGLAWVFPQFCKKIPLCVVWKREESNAKQKRNGLWADGAPVAPWKWRNNVNILK